MTSSNYITFILLGVIGLVFLIDFILNSRKKPLEKSVEKFVEEEKDKKKSWFNLKSFFWIYPFLFILYVFAIVFTGSVNLSHDNMYEKLHLNTYLNIDKTEEINIQEFSDLISKDIIASGGIIPSEEITSSYSHLKYGTKFYEEVSIINLTAYEFNENTTLYIWIWSGDRHYFKLKPNYKIVFKNQSLNKIKEYYISEFERQLFNYNPNLKLADSEKRLYWEYRNHSFAYNPLIDGILQLLIFMLVFAAPLHILFFLVVRFRDFFSNGITYIRKRKKNISMSLLLIIFFKTLIQYFFYKMSNVDSESQYAWVSKNGVIRTDNILLAEIWLFIPVTIVFLIVVWFFNDKIKAR